MVILNGRSGSARYALGTLTVLSGPWATAVIGALMNAAALAYMFDEPTICSLRLVMSLG